MAFYYALCWASEGEPLMGGRVTRPAQSKEILRAKNLRHALESGASPSFIPPGVSAAVQPAALAWNSLQPNSSTPDAADSLDLRRQFLEQLFENSPDALLVVDSSFRAQCVNREF